MSGGPEELELKDALEKAFDFRGDVTLTRKDGSTVEGYIFDRRGGASLADSVVRLYPKDQTGKVSVSYADIAGLEFTGRDTAAREELGSVGEEILREEGGRRKADRVGA